MKRPEVIGLDLDNTVYEYKPCDDVSMAEVSREANRRFGVIDSDWFKAFEASRTELKRRLGATASSHSRLLYFKGALEILGLSSHLEQAIQLERIYWGNYMRAMKKRNGVDHFLEKAREISVPVFIFTDLTAEIQIQKLHRLNLIDLVDGMITSEEAGEDKPGDRFIEIIDKRLNRLGEHWWIIGDSEEKDGALALKLESSEFLLIDQKNAEGFFPKMSKELGSN